jgi:hypothetical protein
MKTEWGKHMREFKERLVILLFAWGLLIALGSLITIADSRIYQVMTFLVTAVSVFGGKRIWAYIKEKQNRRDK